MGSKAALGKAEYRVAMNISRRMAHREAAPTILDLIREIGIKDVICSLDYIHRLEELGMVQRISFAPLREPRGPMPSFA